MKKKEPVCGLFLNLLNGSDGFIINMSSRIIAKIACWSPELIDEPDLKFYLTWLRDQLTVPVSSILFDFITLNLIILEIFLIIYNFNLE